MRAPGGDGADGAREAPAGGLVMNPRLNICLSLYRYLANAYPAYAVVRRRKEIGIRMALGARSRQVQGLVLREGTALVVAGSICGFGGAMALRRAFSALSETLAKGFAQPTVDRSLLVGAPLLLAGLAMLACYLPARRATKIDPMSALR